jgi:hypothetical protein
MSTHGHAGGMSNNSGGGPGGIIMYDGGGNVAGLSGTSSSGNGQSAGHTAPGPILGTGIPSLIMAAAALLTLVRRCRQ